MGQLENGITSTKKRFCYIHPSHLCQPDDYTDPAPATASPTWIQSTNLNVTGTPVSTLRRTHWHQAHVPFQKSGERTLCSSTEVKRVLQLPWIARYHCDLGDGWSLTKKRLGYSSPDPILLVTKLQRCGTLTGQPGSYVLAEKLFVVLKKSWRKIWPSSWRCLPWCWIDRRCDCQSFEKWILRRERWNERPNRYTDGSSPYITMPAFVSVKTIDGELGFAIISIPLRFWP